jgi:hypothetical protein
MGAETAAGDVTADFPGDGVTPARPLSHAERQARYKARKKAERSAGRVVPGRPFESGHQMSVRHGAFSPAVTGPLAQRYASEFASSPSFPADGREDLVLMDAVTAWAFCRAEVELLRQRRDVLDAELGAAGAVDASLTEVTRASETEVRPPGSTMTRDSVIRQQESLARAAHRSEVRLRTLRIDLWKLLEASGKGRKGPSLALIMARMDDEEQAASTG